MLIIDRFEGDFAIVETDNGFINIPRSDLPVTASEGDVLVLGFDKDSTNERKKRVGGMMDKLFKE